MHIAKLNVRFKLVHCLIVMVLCWTLPTIWFNYDLVSNISVTYNLDSSDHNMVSFTGHQDCDYIVNKKIIRDYKVVWILERIWIMNIVFLDFAKAFDKVLYKRLEKKLNSQDITGKLLKWIAERLNNGRQRIRVNVSMSRWHLVLSGVP